MAVHALKRGHLFFLGDRGGEGGRVFVDAIFKFLCSHPVPSVSLPVPNDVSQFPNVFPRAPRIHPTSLPQSSPLSPSRV